MLQNVTLATKKEKGKEEESFPLQPLFKEEEKGKERTSSSSSDDDAIAHTPLLSLSQALSQE